MTYKKAWDKISQMMNEKNYSVTGRQCSTRLNIMKCTYKTVKDHNNKSGNNTRNWKYYEVSDKYKVEKMNKNNKIFVNILFTI